MRELQQALAAVDGVAVLAEALVAAPGLQIMGPSGLNLSSDEAATLARELGLVSSSEAYYTAAVAFAVDRLAGGRAAAPAGLPPSDEPAGGWRLLAVPHATIPADDGDVSLVAVAVSQSTLLAWLDLRAAPQRRRAVRVRVGAGEWVPMMAYGGLGPVGLHEWRHPGYDRPFAGDTAAVEVDGRVVESSIIGARTSHADDHEARLGAVVASARAERRPSQMRLLDRLVARGVALPALGAHRLPPLESGNPDIGDMDTAEPLTAVLTTDLAVAAAVLLRRGRTGVEVVVLVGTGGRTTDVRVAVDDGRGVVPAQVVGGTPPGLRLRAAPIDCRRPLLIGIDVAGVVEWFDVPERA